MIPAPLSLKLRFPGYRAKWRRRYACMLAELAALAPTLDYGEDDGTPWIDLRESELRLFGYWTESANEEVFEILRHDLPTSLPKSHFRLVKDCLNRYVYPHLRPDLKPAGFSADQMFGFHGQHKDAIADLGDSDIRSELTRAFRPKNDDVIIDCGPFLGFGEIRLAPNIPEGKIIAVEADQDCHALLERNLAFNRITNATPLHRAVWNEVTELELQTGFAQSNTLVGEIYQGPQTQKVETITIDTIVESFDLHKVDMVSLTLNGAEVEAIDGGARTLREFRPRIRLAGWYTRQGRKIWSLTKDKLEPLGYRVYVGPRGNVMALPR